MIGFVKSKKLNNNKDYNSDKIEQKFFHVNVNTYIAIGYRIKK